MSSDRTRRGAVIALLTTLLLLGAAVGVSAQSGSLEDALGDSLDVRRGEDVPQADDEADGGDGDGGSTGAGGGSGGSSSTGSGDGASGSEGGDDGSGTSDGLRDPVAPDADGDPAPEGEGPSEDGDAPRSSDEDLDLAPEGSGVEGEGRGPGELELGADTRERTGPIGLAAVLVLGSFATVVAIGRRELVDGG